MASLEAAIAWVELVVVAASSPQMPSRIFDAEHPVSRIRSRMPPPSLSPPLPLPAHRPLPEMQLTALGPVLLPRSAARETSTEPLCQRPLSPWLEARNPAEM